MEDFEHMHDPRPSDPYFPAIGSDAIRLFRLHRLEEGSIGVELKRFLLGSNDCPGFSATSYVWGKPTRSDYVFLNGRRTPVLRSAYEFFRAMLSLEHRTELPSSNTWWWMDSICINQGDPVERSAQVQLMSTIYREASGTVIWLGEAYEDSDRAMDFLHRLAQQDSLKRWSEYHEETERDWKGWKATERLLLREWWGRAWTLQEFLMCRRATFFCGSREISRRDMSSAVNAVWDWHQQNNKIISRDSYEKAWNRFRILQWYNNRRPMPLIGLMAYTASSRVTDPRDRLYSHLGLATVTDRAVVGAPEYESDVRHVYAKFAKSFIENHQSLDIICIAPELTRDATDEDMDHRLNLPSWIPDWSIRLRYSPPVLCMASQSCSQHIGNFRPLHSEDVSCAFMASGTARPQVSFSEDVMQILCAGVSLGRVDGLGGVHHVRYNYPEGLVQSTSMVNRLATRGLGKQQQIKGMHRRYLGLLDTVTRCLVLDRKDRYFRHPAPRAEFEHEFMVLCQAMLTKPDQVYVKFREWFQLNRELLIRGICLENAVLGVAKWHRKVLEKLEKAGFDSEVNVTEPSDWESFLSRARDTVSNKGMKLMVTHTGLLGMAPRNARKGDIVCVLLGCNIPLLLREAPGRKTYQLVGECFVDGYMNGEILKEVDDGSRPVRDFRLG